MHLPSIPSLTILLVLLAFSLQAQDDPPGIYAEFLTSHGAFTASLEWEKAPQTVANFISLAGGTRPWLNSKDGRTERKPFYDGIIFHRVIKNFVIQAGSPAGDGTDGPGYTFRDEVATGLAHDGPYILSMANSGPHSNGSQFFITLAPTPHLDGKHSVFGTVISGRDAVDAIGMVEVDAQGRPVEAVVIDHVAVRRSGEAASAFDVDNQGLPGVHDLPLHPSRDDGVWKVHFAQRDNADYFFFHSSDLRNWTENRLRLNTSPPEGMTPVGLTADIGEFPRRFYRLVEIVYPDDLVTPPSVMGGEFTFDIASHGWLLTASLDDSGEAGTFVMQGTPPDTWSGAITRVEWQPHPYRGVLYLEFEAGTIVPAHLQLVFATLKSGTFSGAMLTTNNLEIAGSFTVARDADAD